jgi:hypothetical protein
MWNWLQPYVDTKPSRENDEAPRPLYNAPEIGPEDGRMRGDPGPYTLLDGFLQLDHPLVKNT